MATYTDNSKGSGLAKYPGGSSFGSSKGAGLATAPGAKSSGSSQSSSSQSGAVYDAYADIFDRQAALLAQQQELAYQRRKARYDAAIQANNRQAAENLRQAYIAGMMAKKDLPAQMRAAGLSGGAAETSMVDLENTYMNNRNDINARLMQANALARRDFDRGVGDDYSKYLELLLDLNSDRLKYQPVTKTSSSTKTSSATRSSSASGTVSGSTSRGRSNGVSSSRPRLSYDSPAFGSGYASAAKSGAAGGLAQIYKNRGYGDDRIKIMLKNIQF